MEPEILEVLNEIRDLIKTRTKQYGVWNNKGWILQGDGLPVCGTYGEIRASIDSLSRLPYNEHLINAEVRELPRKNTQE